MSTIISVIKRIIAALKMPVKIGDKIIKIQGILAKLTGNALFPVSAWPANVVSLAQFGTDVTVLVNAETAVKNKTGTAAARNSALATVMSDLRSIMTMVQLKADANPSTAENTILSAGYLVKTAKTKEKQTNDAQNTEITGVVLLTADAAGQHEWQMSKDTTNVTSLPATATSRTYVYNLNPGDIWYFRNHKVNTKKASYNWSPWVKLMISSGGRTAGGGNLPGHAGSLPTT